MRLTTRRALLASMPALACALAVPRARIARGSAPGSPGFDLAELKAGFKGELITTGSAAYETARRSENLAFDRHPLVVARCADADDAARALDFARNRAMPIAVRGGGHCQAGRSSCDQGVVLDLEMLQSISVDPARGLIACGAGVRVWQANEAGAKYGLALPLGTCGDVGISGLTLGGGVGYLAGTAGAACDALIGADVVLADGRRLAVTSQSDPDLLWALRGAGANFGIVTRLVYRAVACRRVLAGNLTFPAQRAADVLRLTNGLSETLPDELSAFTLIALPPGGEPHVQMGLCWTGEPQVGRRAIEELVTRVVAPVAPLDHFLHQTTLAQFVGRENGGGGMNCARYGIATRPLSEEALALLLDRSGAPQALRLVFFDPLHGAVTRVGTDATAFPRPRTGAGVGFILGWKEAREAAAMRASADRIWGQLEPAMSGAYVNMLDDESEARVREAYGGNYERLRRLKAKYDPDNVFRSNQNIAPAAAASA